MSSVLVTGGCGFIGSNFIHYLLEQDPEALLYCTTGSEGESGNGPRGTAPGSYPTGKS